MEGNWKDSPFIIFQFVFDSKAKLISIRSIFSSRINFINRQPTQSFFKTFVKTREVLLYWFDVKQRTSSLRRQKCACFYSKFNALLDELTLDFCKSKELVQKLKKLKSSQKREIYNTRSLRINKEGKIMERNWKDGPFIIFQFVFDSNAEIVSIRRTFSIAFNFLSPQPFSSLFFNI